MLKRLSPGEPGCCSGAAYAGKSRLAILLGRDFLQEIVQKTIGCGRGAETIEIAQQGAHRAQILSATASLLKPKG